MLMFDYQNMEKVSRAFWHCILYVAAICVVCKSPYIILFASFQPWVAAFFDVIHCLRFSNIHTHTAVCNSEVEQVMKIKSLQDTCTNNNIFRSLMVLDYWIMLDRSLFSESLWNPFPDKFVRDAESFPRRNTGKLEKFTCFENKWMPCFVIKTRIKCFSDTQYTHK